MLEPSRYCYLLHDCLVRVPKADNHNSFIKLRLLEVTIAINLYLRFVIQGELITSLVHFKSSLNLLSLCTNIFKITTIEWTVVPLTETVFYNTEWLEKIDRAMVFSSITQGKQTSLFTGTLSFLVSLSKNCLIWKSFFKAHVDVLWLFKSDGGIYVLLCRLKLLLPNVEFISIL